MPSQPNPGQPPAGAPVEELLAMVAHELRRPLAALLGALATVQQRGAVLPAAQQRELLAIARRQGAHLQQLLDQLLTLDQPKVAMRQWPLVDLARLAQEAGAAAQLANPHHQLTIQAAGPLPVRADPLAISRILGNLLDNAASYSPPGTPIQLTTASNGPQAVVAVDDQGPGVPASEGDRIFQRHVRLEARSHPQGGLGLGLYIARRLARTYHGDLHLGNPPGGHGARFQLRLPLAPPDPDQGGGLGAGPSCPQAP